MDEQRVKGRRGDKPTVRQVYAVAAALCERMGEEFPATRSGASELIERLRLENGGVQATSEEVVRDGAG